MAKCNLGFEDINSRDRFVAAMVDMGYKVTRWRAGDNFSNGRFVAGDGSSVHYEAKLTAIALIYNDENKGGKETLEVYARAHKAEITEE